MYIKVKVVPDAKEEKIEQLKDDEYRIWVKVPAEHNRANIRILELIRNLYKDTSVRLVSGHHSPSKIIAVN